MRRIQSVVGRVVAKLLAIGTETSRSPPEQVYECLYCGRTFAPKPDRCPECRAGRLVPTEVQQDSETGITCRSCGTTVDHRHERCPECGDHRFDRSG